MFCFFHSIVLSLFHNGVTITVCSFLLFILLISALLDDFYKSREEFPDDKELEEVTLALQLSQHALSWDLKTFPSQMLGRIRTAQTEQKAFVSKFLTQCREADHMFLLPDKSVLSDTGRQLVHDIPVAFGSHSVICMRLNKSGTILVAGCDNGYVRTYDVQRGKLLHSLEVKSLLHVRLACNDTLITCHCWDSLHALDVKTGVEKWKRKINDCTYFMIGGKDEGVAIGYHATEYFFCNVWTGQIIGDEKALPESMREKDIGRPVWTANEKWLLVFTMSDVFVFDVESQSFVKHRCLNTKHKILDVVVSPDGESIFLHCGYDDIYSYHTQRFELSETYKAGVGPLSKLHCSLDGKYLYYLTNKRGVVVMDILTKRKATILSQRHIFEVLTSDMETFVTIDGLFSDSIKIWHIGRGDKPGLAFEDGCEDGELEKSQKSVTAFQPTDKPELFLVVWNDFRKHEQFLSLFDVSTRSFLKQYHYQFEMSGQGRLSDVRYLKDWQVIFIVNSSLKILDLKTMKIKTTIQDVLPISYVVVNDGKEVAYLTENKRDLKILDCQTGTTILIPQTCQTGTTILIPQTGLLDTGDEIITNQNGSIVIAKCGGRFLVFNIAERKLDFVIQPEDAKCTHPILSRLRARITCDDCYLLFNGTHEVEAKDLDKENLSAIEVECIHVYNLRERKYEHALVDWDNVRKSERDRLLLRDKGVQSFQLLDDTRLISFHFDCLLRVFNYKTGNLIHRLEGGSSVHFKTCSSMFFAHDYSTKTIRLWDSTNLECLAVFMHDSNIIGLDFIGSDPCGIIGVQKTDAQPVVFTFHGQWSKQLKLTSMPKTINKEYPEFEKSGVGELDLSDPVDVTALDESDSR